jgi:type IV fimbrial biogenesis protein FimT
MFQGNPVATLGQRGSAGVTMVELMVVLVIAAILAAIAAPSLQNLLMANQLTSVTDSFATALSVARSEAAKNGVPVALLSTSGGVDWGSGWIAFVDTNDDGKQEAGEVTVRTGSKLPPAFSMNAVGATAGAFAGVFWFDASGRLLSNANTTAAAPATAPAEFLICQGSGPAAGGAARLITVNAFGRVRMAQNDATGHPLDDVTGKAVTTAACP